MNDDTESQRCRYAYANCLQPRAVKRDGNLHALCDVHRQKANAFQKAYAAKRRLAIQQSKSEDYNEDDGVEYLEPMPLQAGQAHLSAEDCAIFGQIMNK